jgi:plasmid stabilization system protein ParE
MAESEGWAGGCRTMVKETIRFLQANPFVGRERADLKPPGIRSWRLKRFPRWLIFYSVHDDKQIVLLRVRTGNMNLVVLEMKS